MDDGPIEVSIQTRASSPAFSGASGGGDLSESHAGESLRSDGVTSVTYVLPRCSLTFDSTGKPCASARESIPKQHASGQSNAFILEVLICSSRLRRALSEPPYVGSYRMGYACAGCGSSTISRPSRAASTCRLSPWRATRSRAHSTMRVIWASSWPGSWWKR
jgi:hypothetical protein